ncbi:MAG: CopG family ribbon-helix-helix protein [Burkholderiaceae bacterium]
MSSTMSVRLDQEIKERLENLAAATDRSRSFLAAEAIREYVENNEWQIQEIQAALAEADTDGFATEAEVEKLARKWNASAG